MDQAEFLATLATLFELDNPQFDPYKELIIRKRYFEGYEKEEKEYKRRKVEKDKREEEFKKKEKKK